MIVVVDDKHNNERTERLPRICVTIDYSKILKRFLVKYLEYILFEYVCIEYYILLNYIYYYILLNMFGAF